MIAVMISAGFFVTLVGVVMMWKACGDLEKERDAWKAHYHAVCKDNQTNFEKMNEHHLERVRLSNLIQGFHEVIQGRAVIVIKKSEEKQ